MQLLEIHSDDEAIPPPVPHDPRHQLLMESIGMRVIIHDSQGVVVADGELELIEYCEGSLELCHVNRIVPRFGFHDWKIPYPSSPEQVTLSSIVYQSSRFEIQNVKPYQAGDQILMPEKEKKSQAIHNHSPLSVEYQVISWMKKRVQDYGDKHLYTRTIEHWSTQPNNPFRGTKTANIMRAKRWWQKRDVDEEDEKENAKRKKANFFTITRVVGGKRRRILRKAREGRGRKLSDWKVWIFPLLKQEYHRFIISGLGVTRGHLILAAKKILKHSQHPKFNSDFLVERKWKKETSFKKLIDLIDSNFIQSFMEHYDLCLRSPQGKPKVSIEKQKELDQQMAWFLGNIKRRFESGELDEDHVYNFDETHFIIDMRSGKIIVPRGEKECKSIGVVGENDGFTLGVLLRGGKEAKIMPGFVIFKNDRSSYPIQGVPDDVPFVTYQSTPSGFNNGNLFVKWLYNPRTWGCASNGQKTRHLFVDNVGSHNLAKEEVKGNDLLKTEIIPLIENTTHLTQPADQFPIKIIKQIYREYWDEYIISAIEDKLFQQKISKDGSVKGSGKIRNPGKYFILQLMGKVLKEVNLKKDKNGLNFARKSMIGCGLSLNVNGEWKVDMLFPKLRTIVQDNMAFFEGDIIPAGMDEYCADSKEGNVEDIERVEEGAISEGNDENVNNIDREEDPDEEDHNENVSELIEIESEEEEERPYREAGARARHRLRRGEDSEMDKLLDAFLDFEIYNDSIDFDIGI
jgi:hypothetical protein